MILYIFFIVTSLFFSFIEINFSQKNLENKILKIIQFFYIFSLWFIFAFNRYRFDYENYELFFNNVTFQNIISNSAIEIEKGFLFLSFLIKNIGGNLNWIQILLATYFVYVTFKIYKIKYKICFFFLYVSYNFLYDLPQTRNTFFCLLFLHGLKNMLENRKIKFLIFYALSITFHKVGVCYFPFYFFRKLNLKKYLSFLILSCFSCVLFSKLLIFMSKYIFYEHKVNYYLNLSKDNRVYAIFFYAFQILFDLIFILYLKKGKLNGSNENNLFKFMIYPLFYLPLSFFYPDMILRMIRNIFIIKCYFYFNCILQYEKRKKRCIIWSVLVIVHLIFFAFNFRNSKLEFFINLIEQIDNLKI